MFYVFLCVLCFSKIMSTNIMYFLVFSLTFKVDLLNLSTEKNQESLTDTASQSGTSLCNHSSEEAGSETYPDQSNGPSSKDPPLLRELETELLQSGKLKLTGEFPVFVSFALICSPPSVWNTTQCNATQNDVTQHNVPYSFY